MTDNQPRRKTHLLTPIIILLMGLIMVLSTVLLPLTSATAGVFGFVCIALGIGGLYFRKKTSQNKTQLGKEDPR